MMCCPLFEGVCSKLTSSWPPARVKRSWELRLLRHFVWICANMEASAAEFREVTFMRRHRKRCKC